jgi:hypothetical protein
MIGPLPREATVAVLGAGRMGAGFAGGAQLRLRTIGK